MARPAVGRRRWNSMPKSWALLEDVLLADDAQRLDGRDVERELQRVADPQRAALLAVEVGRDVAAAEVGGHVHEHRGRRERALVDAGGIGERLEGRARLTPARREDVELRLHLAADLAALVVVGRADVGDDLAALVVEGREGTVPDVLAAQPLHPGLVGHAQLARQRQPGPARCGTRVAAWIHFSADSWMPMSSVVTTRRPPCSRTSQVSASPQRRSRSSSRTYHTKCGAFHAGLALRHDLQLLLLGGQEVLAGVGASR